MTLSYQIIVGCWVVFVLFWAISAFFVKPTLERVTSSTASLVRIVLLLGVLLVLVQRGHGIHLSAMPPTPMRSAVSDFLCAVGLVVALWARVTLGRNWSASVVFKKGHELVIKGPYLFVRHPIYSGFLLMITGTLIFIGRFEGIIVVLVAITGFWLKLQAEERLMTLHFPKEYAAYKAQTKALIPFVF